LSQLTSEFANKTQIKEKDIVAFGSNLAEIEKAYGKVSKSTSQVSSDPIVRCLSHAKSEVQRFKTELEQSAVRIRREVIG
jgi:hypothetical protein